STGREVCARVGPSSTGSASRFAPRRTPTDVRPYHCPVGAIDWYPAALSAVTAATPIKVPSMQPIVNGRSERTVGHPLSSHSNRMLKMVEEEEGQRVTQPFAW